MQGADRKVVFQGVHQNMGSDIGAPWLEHEERGSKMVFIGVNLPQDVFLQGLEQCLV
jgi:G3E family GTPase